jgi:uncharacterized protein with FMN-binding domain
VRRITLWLVATVTIVVLLFSYRTSLSGPDTVAVAGGAQAPGVVGQPTTGPPTTGPPTTGQPTTGPSATPGSPAATAASGRTVVNGSVAQTRWGPVQVQITVSGHRITNVAAIVYPSGNGRDQSINAYALPQLRQQVLSAQSGQIDGVSGATVTSDGYRESLQAALLAAHFG